MHLGFWSMSVVALVLGCAGGGTRKSDTCCCKLLPLDVSPPTHRMLPRSECTGNGPEDHYDGAECVDGDFCQQ